MKKHLSPFARLGRWTAPRSAWRAPSAATARHAGDWRDRRSRDPRFDEALDDTRASALWKALRATLIKGPTSTTAAEPTSTLERRVNRILPKQPAGDSTAVLHGAIIEEIGWQIEHAYMVGIVMRRWLGAEEGGAPCAPRLPFD